MSSLSRQTTWETGDVLTAQDLNDEFDNIINDYNGGISNANISATAGIAWTKISKSGSQLTDLGDVSGTPSAGQYLKYNGGWAPASLTLNRGFPFGIPGTLITGDEQGMKYIVPQAMTVTNIRAKTDSGTCTIRIQTDTTNIDASADVTSSAGNITSFDSTALTAGQVLTLDILSVSSASGLWVIVETTQP